MKDIPGYEGLYGATEDGRIYSYINNRYLTPSEYRTGNKKHQGYMTVKLSKHGSSITCHVHDLICRAYKPKPARDMEIDHLDEDRHNNSVDNLEWVSHEENMRRKNTRHYSTAIECVETG